MAEFRPKSLLIKINDKIILPTGDVIEPVNELGEPMTLAEVLALLPSPDCPRSDSRQSRVEITIYVDKEDF